MTSHFSPEHFLALPRSEIIAEVHNVLDETIEEHGAPAGMAILLEAIALLTVETAGDLTPELVAQATHFFETSLEAYSGIISEQRKYNA